MERVAQGPGNGAGLFLGFIVGFFLWLVGGLFVGVASGFGVLVLFIGAPVVCNRGKSLELLGVNGADNPKLSKIRVPRCNGRGAGGSDD